MARPRKKGRNVPPGVYFNYGRWFLRRDGKETRLAGADATVAEVWAAFFVLTKPDVPDSGTLEWLCDEYFKSTKFEKLTPATQRDYRICKKVICDTKLKDGSRFGTVVACTIDPPMIARYRDKREEQSPSRANRELAFLSVVFSRAVEVGAGKVKSNPVKGVSRIELKHRTRCPTDAEYAAVYKHAPQTIQIAMEIAYLCRLRWSEVFGTDLSAKHDESAPGLLRQHIDDDKGLKVIRGKGSKTQVISWTPRLRETVNRALKLPSTIGTMRVIHDEKGQKIRYDAFHDAWEAAVAAAVKSDGIEPFRFHDLKRKGVTDAKGDKLAASGHKSAAMLGTYDMSVPEVGPTK
jgi:integrase